MTKYFMQFKVGNRIVKDKVSAQGCEDVADFKEAIKKNFHLNLIPMLHTNLPFMNQTGKRKLIQRHLFLS